MIMRRSSDGKWVKVRCKECGDASFGDVKEFVKHCAFLHKRRFKSQDEAVEECGFPLKSYNPSQVSRRIPLSIATSTEGNMNQRTPSNSAQEDETQEPLAKKAKTVWQEQFVCMGRSDATAKGENPNAYTIEKLQEMADFYERTGDKWRSLSFRRGNSTLKKQTKKITTKEEALRLPFVGNSLAEAIEKIAHTGKLSRLDATKEDPLNQSLQIFMAIYGVGLSQATKWVCAGFRTLDDLREKAQLSENQEIGLEHYDDLQSRIPRTEVEAHGDIFKTAVAGIDPAFEVTIGGSYRRGSQTSGDIDLIITKPGANLHQIRTIILNQVVTELFATGFLKAELARTSSDTGSKWHGCSALNDNAPWRRIDFLLVPWDEMGAALIYFTGNDIFNRSIRLLASRKGMRLNQRGLFKDIISGKDRLKVAEVGLLESKSEKKIFEILGVPWRPPEHRNC
jgi:DNA polymerase IV